MNHEIEKPSSKKNKKAQINVHIHEECDYDPYESEALI